MGGQLHELSRQSRYPAESDPASRVNRANIPATCGACHEGIRTQYASGVHGAAFATGDVKAPVCADCHSAHGIQRADTPAWQLGVIQECGRATSNGSKRTGTRSMAR
jgi:hypothetical protein